MYVVGQVGQLPNPLDFIQQFLPGQQTVVTPPKPDPLKEAMPLVLGGVLVLGVIWYATK